MMRCYINHKLNMLPYLCKLKIEYYFYLRSLSYRKSSVLCSYQKTKPWVQIICHFKWLLHLSKYLITPIEGSHPSRVAMPDRKKVVTLVRDGSRRPVTSMDLHNCRLDSSVSSLPGPWLIGTVIAQTVACVQIC